MIHYLTNNCQALCSHWINNVDPDETASDEWRLVSCQNCLNNKEHNAAKERLNTLEVFKILVGIE